MTRRTHTLVLVEGERPPTEEGAPGAPVRAHKKKQHRQLKIQRAVAEGLKARGALNQAVVEPQAALEPGPVLRPLKRQKLVQAPAAVLEMPPVTKDLKLEKAFFPAVRRCVLWLAAFFLYSLQVLLDRLRGRDSIESRASRLLVMFQKVGGTVIKIGQQLSMRIDVLPYAYCRELAKLLESVKPFPTEEAIKAIERSTGKRLDELFAAFDPVPIGSASVACVYHAVLKTGEAVAVKVRRPDIQRVFGADLRALGWFIKIIEGLTLVRPGMLTNFGVEFESTFEEELDFRKEARYQEIFRRNAKKKSMTPNRFFTAPKVFFDHSNAEVLVTEFVTGVWLKEMIVAVENKDEVALQRMRELNIDPKEVARRLIWINQWSTLQNVIFHADPHPANIVVEPDNRIVFIDFGACGSMDRRQREAMQQVFLYQAQKDVYGMVRSTMVLLEPLAHVDALQLEKELELVYWQVMYKSWSKHSAWYERTTASLWFGFLEVARKYQLPLQLDAVRTMRATLLYDTVAFRLHNDLRISERQQFLKDRIRRTGKRLRRQLWRRVEHAGPLNKDYARLDEVLQTANQAFHLFRNFINTSRYTFSYAVEKGVYSVIVIIHMVTRILIATALGVGGLLIYRLIKHQGLGMQESLWTLLTNPWCQAILAFIVLQAIRRILFRLSDREVENPGK